MDYIRLFVITLVLLPTLFLNGLQRNAHQLDIYAISGLNGGGSEIAYVERLFQMCHTNITRITTPPTVADLGQSNCMRYLREAFAQDDPEQTAIIHASSQGTATALNYLAYEDKGRHIKGLILEGVLASGNSAVCHTAREDGLGRLVNLPGSYYWMPYCAKFFLPWYWPAGKQPITAIAQIPITIPIIIVHSKHDFQLPYDGACALYYGLRAHGNNNVYLISKEGYEHLWLLGDDAPDQRAAVLAILNAHGLLPEGTPVPEIDLTPYQPDPLQFKPLYDGLVFKEKVHRYVGYGLGLGALYATWRISKRIYSAFAGSLR